MIRASICMLSILALPVRAWEPAPVDIMQQAFSPESEVTDHLEPSSRPIDERYYVVRYTCDEAMAYQDDFLEIDRNNVDGKFVLKKWSEWAKTEDKPPANEKLRPAVELEIPQDLAADIYEIWVNALYEVRYDRTFNGTLDGWTDVYSAYVRGKGWMIGEAETPEKELPPKWLKESTTALIQLSKDRDVTACRQKIMAMHDKLFTYWRAHGVSVVADGRIIK
jgi:hypothetical protein